MATPRPGKRCGSPRSASSRPRSPLHRRRRAGSPACGRRCSRQRRTTVAGRLGDTRSPRARTRWRTTKPIPTGGTRWARSRSSGVPQHAADRVPGRRCGATPGRRTRGSASPAGPPQPGTRRAAPGADVRGRAHVYARPARHARPAAGSGSGTHGARAFRRRWGPEPAAGRHGRPEHAVPGGPGAPSGSGTSSSASRPLLECGAAPTARPRCNGPICSRVFASEFVAVPQQAV